MMDRSFTGKSEPHDKSLGVIIAAVLAAHALACAWIAFADNATPKPTPKQETRRLTVQTVALKAPQRPPVAAPVATAAPPPATQPMPAPTAEPVAAAEKAPPPTPKADTPPVPPPPQPKPAPPSPPPPVKKTAPSPKPAPQPLKKAPPPKPAAAQAAPKQPAVKQPMAKAGAAKPAAAKAPPKTATTEQNAAEKATAEKAAKELAQKKLADEQASQARAAKERQQALISQAQERIAKIARSHDKMTPDAPTASLEMSLPGALSGLKVDDLADGETVLFGAQEASYRDELAGRMKLLLRLPEYGDVKMKLTLERSGKVVKVVITSAQSANNRSYIEKTVPTLSFPPFGHHFGTEAQHTFSITLSNDL